MDLYVDTRIDLFKVKGWEGGGEGQWMAVLGWSGGGSAERGKSAGRARSYFLGGWRGARKESA